MTDTPHHQNAVARFIGSPSGLVLCLGVSAVGGYLLLYHTRHVLEALPYLALLACPLMHVFMHRGHHRDRSEG